MPYFDSIFNLFFLTQCHFKDTDKIGIKSDMPRCRVNVKQYNAVVMIFRKAPIFLSFFT